MSIQYRLYDLTREKLIQLCWDAYHVSTSCIVETLNCRKSVYRQSSDLDITDVMSYVNERTIFFVGQRDDYLEVGLRTNFDLDTEYFLFIHINNKKDVELLLKKYHLVELQDGR